MKKYNQIKQSIKRAIGNFIKSFSLAWGNKHLIVTLSLLVCLLVESGITDMYLPKISQAEADIIVVISEPERTTLEIELENRALELFENSKNLRLEQDRQEAIAEQYQKLLSLSTTSPFVNYDELEEKYGY